VKIKSNVYNFIMFSIVFRQTITMFVYMLAGFILFRIGKITEEGSKSFSDLLVHFIFPVVIVKSFMREFSSEVLRDFFIGFVLCGFAIALSMLISRFFFRKHPIDCFAASFSNTGFFGVPLVTAVMGPEMVIYSIGSSFFVGTFQYSYGVGLITGEKGKFVPKRIFLAPNFVGTVIGFVIFVLGLGNKFPPVMVNVINGISAMNAPVVMMILGSYLAKSDFSKMIKNSRIYVVSLIRLVVIPLATILVFFFVPIEPKIKLAIILCVSTPCGANVAVYCQLYDRDYLYGCQSVTMSTLFGLVLLPVIANIAQFVFAS